MNAVSNAFRFATIFAACAIFALVMSPLAQQAAVVVA